MDRDSGLRRLRVVHVLLLGVFLLTPACFTTSLWSDADDPVVGEDEHGVPVTEPPATIWQKILLTPLALALDLVTAPVQNFFDEDDDDDSYYDGDDDC